MGEIKRLALIYSDATEEQALIGLDELRRAMRRSGCQSCLRT